MRDAKTADQLTREIGYFQQQLARTSSSDRIKRARQAIRRRQRELLQLARVVRVR